MRTRTAATRPAAASGRRSLRALKVQDVHRVLIPRTVRRPWPGWQCLRIAPIERYPDGFAAMAGGITRQVLGVVVPVLLPAVGTDDLLVLLPAVIGIGAEPIAGTNADDGLEPSANSIRPST